MQSHRLFSHLLLHHVSGLGPAKQRLARSLNAKSDELIQQPISFWRQKIRLPAKGCSQLQQWQTLGLDSGLAQKALEDLVWLESSDRHHIISPECPDYPKPLKNIYDPPAILYLVGQLSCLKRPMLAVVGARSASRYGLDSAYHLSQKISQSGWVVVSGLAKGIDGLAHEACVQQDLSTVAVMGCGVDVIYPKNHYKLYQDIPRAGLLVSEFPLGTLPRPGYFPQRNRIIAGLSQGTLVIEAAEKSGSLITAQMALEEGREVFALPGSMFNPMARGGHRLIQQGAKLILDADDLLMDLSRLDSTTVTATLDAEDVVPGVLDASNEANRVFSQLTFDPISFDDLLLLTELAHETLQSALLELEMLQLVAMVPGGICKVIQ